MWSPVPLCGPGAPCNRHPLCSLGLTVIPEPLCGLHAPLWVSVVPRPPQVPWAIVVLGPVVVPIKAPLWSPVGQATLWSLGPVVASRPLRDARPPCGFRVPLCSLGLIVIPGPTLFPTLGPRCSLRDPLWPPSPIRVPRFHCGPQVPLLLMVPGLQA